MFHAPSIRKKVDTDLPYQHTAPITWCYLTGLHLSPTEEPGPAERVVRSRNRVPEPGPRTTWPGPVHYTRCAAQTSPQESNVPTLKKKPAPIWEGRAK